MSCFSVDQGDLRVKRAHFAGMPEPAWRTTKGRWGGRESERPRRFDDIEGSNSSIARWRSRRDSNPRYAFGAYNGLANRRLQPLGHSSARGKAYAFAISASNTTLQSKRQNCT